MLNAEEARKMTNNTLIPNADLIKPYLKHIETKIKVEITRGRQQLIHPFRDLPKNVKYPHENIKKGVKKAMEANGYTWKEHPDPDPGYPGSGPYDEISW